MRRLAVGLSLLTALCADPVAAADSPPRVTYIANEGFLIEAGERKILVDALFHEETIDWCHVPGPDVLSRMTKAEAPFDAVDLVSITHEHTDHFDPATVLDHLVHNPQAVVVGPPQAIDRLRTHETWQETWSTRIHELDLGLFESEEIDVRGIRIAAHRVRHCAYREPDPTTGEPRDRHENVENLAYLFEIDGFRALHLGDAFIDENRKYLAELFRDTQIDLVFFEGWNQPSLDFIRERAPRHVLAMHLPPDPEQIERIARYLSDQLPNVVVMAEPMERRVFDVR